MRQPLILLGVISATLTAVAVGVFVLQTGDRRSEDRISAIAEAVPADQCASEACLSRKELEAAVGFRVLEPVELKDGLILWNRTLHDNEVPLAVREMVAADLGIPLIEVPMAEPANVAVLSYRFRSSDHVPAVWIYEELSQAEGALPKVRLRDPSCGAELTAGSRKILYIAGEVERAPPDQDNAWPVCLQESPFALNLHTVLLTEGSLLIEIQGFPDTGVTKDDVLRIAASLR